MYSYTRRDLDLNKPEVTLVDPNHVTSVAVRQAPTSCALNGVIDFQCLAVDDRSEHWMYKDCPVPSDELMIQS